MECGREEAPPCRGAEGGVKDEALPSHFFTSYMLIFPGWFRNRQLRLCLHEHLQR